MNDYIEWQMKISERADSLVETAIENGQAFTEGLCNWAINQALREISKPGSETTNNKTGTRTCHNRKELRQ